MAYTAPRTWVVNELLTAALLNEQLRDNELYLKELALHLTAVAESAADTSFNSATYVDVNSMAVTLTLTQACDVFLSFWCAPTFSSGGGNVRFAFFEGAVHKGLDGGGKVFFDYCSPGPISMTHLVLAVDAGAHTYKVCGKTDWGTPHITDRSLIAMAIPNA